MKSHAVYNQRFHTRSASIHIICTENSVCIDCKGLSEVAMNELMDELLYDGYAETGELSDGCIVLYDADPWMCGEENLKEMIHAKMDSMNYEVTFLA